LVSWTQPNENGAEITAYLIQILTSDGTTYLEETTNCDGTDATIIVGTYCEVPMTSLVDSSTFNLIQGTEIVVKISALNYVGWSLESADSTSGLLIMVAPL